MNIARFLLPPALALLLAGPVAPASQAQPTEAPDRAQPPEAPEGFGLETVLELDFGTGIAFGPDERIFVGERSGRIRNG